MGLFYNIKQPGEIVQIEAIEGRELSPQERFSYELYIEQYEEASFLYEQRTYLRSDPEFSWTDMETYEDRFINYVEALISGNKIIDELCLEQALTDASGNIYASIVILYKRQNLESIFTIIDAIDHSDSEQSNAFVDAVNEFFSQKDQVDLVLYLLDKTNNPVHIISAARIAGYNRLDLGEQFFNLPEVDQLNTDVICSILYAIGRMKPFNKNNRNTINVFRKVLTDNEDVIIYTNAIIALFKIYGNAATLENIFINLENNVLSYIPLSFYGGKNIVVINKSVQALNNPTLNAGFTGNTQIIPELIEALSKNETAENASIALHLITGEEFLENHFIPDEIDEDTLFEDELEKHKKGKLYAPGEEPGVTITRLSQNPEVWQLWWEKNQSNYSPEITYRNGKPLSKECLIENLKSKILPDYIRRIAYEEMLIQYNIDTPFEIDMRVKDQITAIQEMETHFSDEQ